MFSTTMISIGLLQATNPLVLPIGRSGTVEVRSGEIVDLARARRASVEDIAWAARSTRFVYLGESHDDPFHHRFQAKVIEALVAAGRNVVVGFEMFTRPVQDALNPWTLGWWSREEFIERSDWKRQWGFDFSLYEPIFEVTRKHRLPMVALNVPRDWVRAVGRGGPTALPEDAKGQVPDLDLSNADHRKVFDALMGGHPMTGAQGANVYAGQVLWDTAMADSAVRYLSSRPSDSKTVMVVIAGSGHAMYGQGINYRVAERTGDRGITVIMVGAEGGKATVSRGLGDFVYCSG